jgi:hypothetical protein
MTTTSFYVQATLVAFCFSPFAIACGSGGGSPAVSSSAGASSSADIAGASNSASAGAGGLPSGGGGNVSGTVSGGAVTVADDGKPFVPDDIKYSIVEGGRALTLLSATVINDATGVYWFIAVRNDEAVPICIPQVNAAFTDAMASSNSAGGQTVIMIQGPMYQSDAGAHPCLMPGSIGMGVQAVSGLDSTPKITAIEYQPRGYPSPEAMKLPDLAVEGVKISDDAMGRKLVTGTVANHGTGPASGPELTIFTVDSGGRPFDAGYARSMTDLAAGSSWPFQVTIRTPFNKYVAVPVWGQQ